MGFNFWNERELAEGLGGVFDPDPNDTFCDICGCHLLEDDAIRFNRSLGGDDRRYVRYVICPDCKHRKSELYE